MSCSVCASPSRTERLGRRRRKFNALVELARAAFEVVGGAFKSLAWLYIHCRRSEFSASARCIECRARRVARLPRETDEPSGNWPPRHRVRRDSDWSGCPADRRTFSCALASSICSVWSSGDSAARLSDIPTARDEHIARRRRTGHALNAGLSSNNNRFDSRRTSANRPSHDRALRERSGLRARTRQSR